MGAFARDVERGALPLYSFIEPQHVLPPWNSQHPSSGVSHGEKLIADVYNALVASPRVFERSLLLVVYDEHGGFYDHVVPPGHAGWNRDCPHIVHDVLPPDDARSETDGRERGYDFTSLGPRVPAVVVSPWIERGSVFGWKARDEERRVTFDHTSILATVGGMTGVWVDSRRARVATALDVTINRSTPRTDYPRRLVHSHDDYSEVARIDPSSDVPCEGVAAELCDAYRARRGSATPAELVEHYRALTGR
jgi:phospholipase C